MAQYDPLDPFYQSKFGLDDIPQYRKDYVSTRRYSACEKIVMRYFPANYNNCGIDDVITSIKLAQKFIIQLEAIRNLPETDID